MFLVDTLVKPISNTLSFGAVTGSVTENIKGVYETVAQKDKVLVALDHSTKNRDGIDAELTDVNCLSFDGSGDYIKIESASGIDLTLANNDAFGSCVITATFKYTSNGAAQVIHSLDASSYRVYINSSTFFLNSSTSTGITASSGDLYRITTTYNSSGEVTNFVAENLTDDTTDTFTGGAPAGSHQGAHSFHIGARQTGLSLNGIISNVSVTDSSVGANFHLPLQEGSGTKAYDVSGNGNHGTIVNANWSTLDGIESWNHEYGFDASAVFDGSDDYVDTGLDADTAITKASFTIKPVNNSDNRVILGLANKGGSGNSSTYIDTGQKLRYKARSSGSTPVNRCDTTLLTAGSTYDVVIDYETDVVTINGVTQSFTQTTGFTHTGSNVLIGARFNGGVLSKFYAGEIYSLKLETSSGVIRDFVSSNDKLYDKINGVYYSNDGTGDIETKRYPALNTKTKQVATFDGVDDYVDTGVSDQLVKKYSVTFTPTEITNGVILGLRISRPACFELMADGSIRTGLFEGEARDNNTGANQTNTTTLVAGTKYTVEVDYDNNEIKINDVVQSTSIVAGRNHTNDNVWIGGRRDSGTLQTPFKGIIHSVKLESATAVLAEYDFQNDIGTTTIQDISPQLKAKIADIPNGSYTGTNVTNDVITLAASSNSIVKTDKTLTLENISGGGNFVAVQLATVANRRYRFDYEYTKPNAGGSVLIQTPVGGNISINEGSGSVEFTAGGSTTAIGRNSSAFIKAVFTKFELYDLDGNDGTATIGEADINTGAGGLAEFWGTRVADNNGSLVSADYATGNTSISNPAGFVHNNSECGVKLHSQSVITGDGVDDFVTLPSLTGVRSKTIATKITFPSALLSAADNEEGAVYGLVGTESNLTPHLAVGFTADNGIHERALAFRDGGYQAGGFEYFRNSTDYATKFAGKTLWVIIRVDNENHQLHVDIEGEINVTQTKSASIEAQETAPAQLYETGIGGWVNTSVGDKGKVPIFDFIYYERVLSDSEVEGIYSGTIPSGAAYQYDFSEAQGTTITDLSSNGNNSTITVGSSGTETFWNDSYWQYPNVLSRYSFIPSEITVTGLSDADANTTYLLSGYGEFVSGSGFYWTAYNGYFIALDDGGPYWAIYNDIGDELSDNTAAGATLLPAEGSWSNSAVVTHSNHGLFISKAGTNITKLVQYDADDTTLTSTEQANNERYFG